MVSEVRHMLLVLVVRVAAFVSHRVVILSVDAAMVHGAIVEVL